MGRQKAKNQSSILKSIYNPLRWANLAVILITLLSYLSPIIDPAKFWHFSIFGLAYPILIIANVAFLVFWAIQQDRYFFFSLGCILVGFSYLGGFFGTSFFESNLKEKGDIVVVSYNTASFWNLAGLKANIRDQKMKPLEKLAADEGGPDIFCVQETTGEFAMETLKKTFGFTHYYKSKGTIIFSRFPIVNQGVVAFENTSNSCVWTDLKTPKGTLRVYNVHLQSNKLTSTANKIASEGDIREKQTWRDVRFVISRYKQNVRIRAGQAKTVAKHMAQSPHPVILCGDFNDPPLSYAYRVLSKNLQDSFREKGSGLGKTYAGKLPALRIDYVLAGESILIKEHRVSHLELSDHFPVLVRLSL